MAQTTIGTPLGFVGAVVDKRANYAVDTSPMLTAVFNATKDVPTLRAALAATGLAAYNTPAKLDPLTVNDMVYALRLASDAAGV